MRIKDICSGVTDGSHTPPQGLENSDYLMLSSKNVFDDKITFDSPRYLSQIDFEQESKRTRIKSGDVLLTIVGTVGRAAVVGENMPQFTLQRSVAVLHPNVEICDSRYLMYALQANRNHIESRAKGVAQKGIYLKEVADIELQIPLLSEQTHRVKVLDKIAFVIKFHQKQLQKLDELVKARFVELFGDPLTNPKGYQEKYLSEIAEYWNGLTYKPDDVANEGTIVLRSSNIQNASLDFADTVRVNCKIGTKKYVQDNDILMCSRNGSAKLVGKVALIKELSEPMSFGAFMMIIRSAYYPFLMTYFQLPAFRSQITTGATTTINQITGRMLDNVKLAIPDIESAKDFSAFTNQVDKSKVAVQKSLDEAQLLFDSLMQQYFG